MPRTALLLLLLALVCHSSEQANAQSAIRGMVPEDYYRFVFVSDPQPSPDGERVAFVRSVTSPDRRSRHTNIWIVSADGSEDPRPFTADTTDAHPRWSPDGTRLGFLRRDGKTTRLFTMAANGGEAVAATRFDTSVTAFHWSPDGTQILLELRTASDTTAARPTNTSRNPDVTRVTRTKYKQNGRGYLDSKRNHFWLFDPNSGDLKQLTEGDHWNDQNPDWSPDGKWVAFDSDRSGQEYDGGDNDDLWIVSADGSLRERLTDAPHQDADPAWSPDGRLLAYLHQETPYAQPEIFLFPTGTAEPELLTGDFDRNPSGILWSPDGNFLYFTAEDEGAVRAFRLRVADRTVETLTDERLSVSDIRLTRDGAHVVFAASDIQQLPEIWLAGADGGEARRLTHFNRPLTDSLSLQSLVPIRFRSPDGADLHGFILRPVGFEEGTRYPFVLEIKGGPGGMWGNAWFHEFQMLAAAGYAVGFVNYRGSSGYGFTHQNAVRLDYGGVDFRDNMAFVDEVLRRFNWIDPERLLVTGGSHGGFLTNWIVTQTDRFKAAVTQRSVSNWISEAGTQQYTPLQMTREFGGTHWENFDLYWERSPLRLANRVTTPTLILHSDEDLICPIGQAQEWFYALQQNGVASEMVVFHDENHSLSRTGKPVNLVERLKFILDWFARYGS